MSKKKVFTTPLTVRRSPAERDAIKKVAARAKLSEARLMVTAALMLNDFKTEEELRAALYIGGQLWQTRTRAVMQVRRVGHQLERLRKEVNLKTFGEDTNKLGEALGEVAAALKDLGASWRAPSRK